MKKRGRGRPSGQITPSRAKVMTYWRKHGPCPVMQLVRATGVERSRAKRILRDLNEMGKLIYRPICERAAV